TRLPAALAAATKICRSLRAHADARVPSGRTPDACFAGRAKPRGAGAGFGSSRSGACAGTALPCPAPPSVARRLLGRAARAVRHDHDRGQRLRPDLADRGVVQAVLRQIKSGFLGASSRTPRKSNKAITRKSTVFTVRDSRAPSLVGALELFRC